MESYGVCLSFCTVQGIGELAFGEWGRRFITVVLYTELLGTCGLFFILEGDHLALLLGDATGLDSNQFMLLSSLLILPTTWLADLSALSYVGVLGGGAALTLAGVITNEFLHRNSPLPPLQFSYHPMQSMY
jgi:vesicular inhibitory amino acid transporter